jgi:branched-subunit amino acid aminotransferase/4-amino-4-deoxychorismate lyase
MRLPSFVSRNGALIDPSVANVSIFTPALSGSYGVYESMHVTSGRVFALQAHLERLQGSARQLGISLPASSTIAAWVGAVLVAHESPDCTLRLFVVGAEDGAEPTVFVWPQLLAVYPLDMYRQGVAAITYAGARALPTAKSLDALVAYLARRRAGSMGVHEALLYHDGRLTEGSNSNLFVVRGGVLQTAPAAQVLSGVTRDVTLQLAREWGQIRVDETDLWLADVPEWEEAFITSTSRHIMPLTRLDGRPIGKGAVGPVTNSLMVRFESYFEAALATVQESASVLK